MTTSDGNSVVESMVGLQNLTLYLDEIGLEVKNSTYEKDIFGMLLRLEFLDFSGYMSGKVMCNINLEMDGILEAFSNFASFDILFMVSREEFSSGTTGFTEYIKSMKKVWRSQNNLMHQIYSYIFEETVFDGRSDFTAEMNLVDEVVLEDAMLNIEVYPYPTVVHYVSYDRDSYLDWLADMGGFYPLIVGVFFVLSTRLTKLANRRSAFHRKQGILPTFSLSHRNAEELSALRSLVLTAFGITG